MSIEGINLTDLMLQASNVQEAPQVQTSDKADLFATLLTDRIKSSTSTVNNLSKSNSINRSNNSKPTNNLKNKLMKKDLQNRDSLSYELGRNSASASLSKADRADDKSVKSADKKDKAEKFSDSKAEDISKSAEKLVNKSTEILKYLSDEECLTDEQKLEALKQDKTVGEFWQSIDQDTALQLVALLNSDLKANSSENATAQSQTVENIVLDLLEEIASKKIEQEAIQDSESDSSKDAVNLSETADGIELASKAESSGLEERQNTDADVLESKSGGIHSVASKIKAIAGKKQEVPNDEANSENVASSLETSVQSVELQQNHEKQVEHSAVNKHLESDSGKSSASEGSEAHNSESSAELSKIGSETAAKKEAFSTEASNGLENKNLQDVLSHISSSNPLQANEVSTHTLFSQIESGEAVKSVDFSELLKQITDHEAAEKQTARDLSNVTAQPSIKKVAGANNAGNGRDLSFLSEQSGETLLRTDVSQEKGEEKVRSSLFSQIVEKAEFFKAPQQIKIMTLQLKPESLGKLEMHLATKDGAVTARISAENQLVKDKIEQLVPQIREHLQEQGVNILQISVDISSNYSDGKKGAYEENAKNLEFHASSKNSSSLSALTTDKDGTSTPINSDIRRMALHIKSVDITV